MLAERSHRRFNPLSGEWVLVSPHRTQRPWQGQVEKPASGTRPPYDPTCYLCPGNVHANGERNAYYTSTFVLTNDFAVLELASSSASAPEPVVLDADGLLAAAAEPGTSRVIRFSPRHDLTLSCRLATERGATGEGSGRAARQSES